MNGDIDKIVIDGADDLNLLLGDSNELYFNPSIDFNSPNGVEVRVRAVDAEGLSVEDVFMWYMWQIQRIHRENFIY